MTQNTAQLAAGIFIQKLAVSDFRRQFVCEIFYKRGAYYNKRPIVNALITSDNVCYVVLTLVSNSENMGY